MQAQSVCVCVWVLKCHNEYGFHVEPNENKLATATDDSQNMSLHPQIPHC